MFPRGQQWRGQYYIAGKKKVIKLKKNSKRRGRSRNIQKERQEREKGKER